MYKELVSAARETRGCPYEKRIIRDARRKGSSSTFGCVLRNGTYIYCILLYVASVCCVFEESILRWFLYGRDELFRLVLSVSFVETVCVISFRTGKI